MAVGVFFQDKTTVIQEARVFNESPISPRKCRILLTKIIYLLYIGETFGTTEATTLFFGVTKLFQHKDVSMNSRASRDRHADRCNDDSLPCVRWSTSSLRSSQRSPKMYSWSPRQS